MAKHLSDLLKFKKEISIFDPAANKEDPKTKPIAKVWVRLLGDEDLKEAYKYARIASSEKRTQLRNKESDDYKDAIAQLYDVPKENLIFLMKASRESTYSNEASIIVERPDLPKIEEIAQIPDAPTLEEQEVLDKTEKDIEDKYAAALKDYVDTKLTELEAELNEMSDIDLFDIVSNELINIQAMEAFSLELKDQKGYRGTYEDETCKERAFSSIDDFKNTLSLIKSQVIEGYESLEITGDELKN